MTHERVANNEADRPELDDTLPNAWGIPTGDGPDDVDPMTDPEDWDHG